MKALESWIKAQEILFHNLQRWFPLLIRLPKRPAVEAAEKCLDARLPKFRGMRVPPLAGSRLDGEMGVLKQPFRGDPFGGPISEQLERRKTECHW